MWVVYHTLLPVQWEAPSPLLWWVVLLAVSLQRGGSSHLFVILENTHELQGGSSDAGSVLREAGWGFLLIQELDVSSSSWSQQTHHTAEGLSCRRCEMKCHWSCGFTAFPILDLLFRCIQQHVDGCFYYGKTWCWFCFWKSGIYLFFSRSFLLVGFVRCGHAGLLLRLSPGFETQFVPVASHTVWVDFFIILFLVVVLTSSACMLFVELIETCMNNLWGLFWYTLSYFFQFIFFAVRAASERLFCYLSPRFKMWHWRRS